MIHSPKRSRLPVLLAGLVLLIVATVAAWPAARAALAPTQSAACGPFADVASTHPACGAILQLVNQGVINGYPDGTFQPENQVTRAEFATMAVRAFGQTPDPGGALPFPDVAGHWAASMGYIQTAVAMGAVNGFEDGTFRPQEPVTRAQAVKIAAATLNLYPMGTSPYTDVSPGDWFAGWVAVGHQARLIGPQAVYPLWTGSSFGGNTPATRAQAAMLLANLPMSPADAELAISARAAQAISALKHQDMTALAGLVHPVKGVRFTPYCYVNSGNLVFPAAALTGALSDPTVHTWGAYDGTGDPIDLTFSQYYAQFIYDQDFLTAPEVTYNVVWQRGNSINNLLLAYPASAWIEYHFPGFDPMYGGMDWRSLRLVFEEHSGDWYLVGIIHGQWTI